MKLKVLLILFIFIISIFFAACKNDKSIDVKGYREGLKSSQKKSMPVEKKKEIEKNIFPSIEQK